MSDDSLPPDPAQMSAGSADTLPAKLVYIFYLAGWFLAFLPFVGVVVAYLNIGTAPAWLAAHYRFQIRTFWIALMMFCASVPLFVIGAILLAHDRPGSGFGTVIAGLICLFLPTLYVIIRSLRGLISLSRDEAHPQPDSLGFG